MSVGSDQNDNSGLPNSHQIADAIRIYLDLAYGKEIPLPIRRFIPPGQFVPAQWLMNDFIERDFDRKPEGQKIRSFGLRMGNSIYPHMKLRITLPPKSNRFLFQIDSHDEVLTAPSSSADLAALEELKRHNASLVEQMVTSMDAAGLLTERGYLREGIARARRKQL